MAMRLSHTLKAERAKVVCAQCEEALCDLSAHWKEKAALSEAPMSRLGLPYSTGEQVLLRVFSCPHCGALLDTETALPGEPFLRDEIFLS